MAFINTYIPLQQPQGEHENKNTLQTSTYFPLLDNPISHFSFNAMQFSQGCFSITLHRMRRRLQVVHAFLARGLAGVI